VAIFTQQCVYDAQSKLILEAVYRRLNLALRTASDILVTFVIYLTTLSDYIALNDRMKNELEGMWKETGVG
jgi:hypothetical protein